MRLTKGPTIGELKQRAAAGDAEAIAYFEDWRQREHARMESERQRIIDQMGVGLAAIDLGVGMGLPPPPEPGTFMGDVWLICAKQGSEADREQALRRLLAEHLSWQQVLGFEAPRGIPWKKRKQSPESVWLQRAGAALQWLIDDQMDEVPVGEDATAEFLRNELPRAIAYELLTDACDAGAVPLALSENDPQSPVDGQGQVGNCDIRDRREQCARLRGEGKSIYQISQAVDASESTVKRDLDFMGLTKKKRGGGR